MVTDFLDDFFNVAMDKINNENYKKKINILIDPYISGIERKFNYFMIVLFLLNIFNLFTIYLMIYYFKKNDFEVPNFSISDDI